MVETEPDEVLAVRAREDREAFAELYHRYVKRIYTYIYYRTGSVPDAEDLASRTFMQAFTRPSRR